MESVGLCLPLHPQLRLQPHQHLLLQLEGQDRLYQVFLHSVNQLLTAAYSEFYPKFLFIIDDKKKKKKKKLVRSKDGKIAHFIPQPHAAPLKLLLIYITDLHALIHAWSVILH